jgi:hypothetical protein
LVFHKKQGKNYFPHCQALLTIHNSFMFSTALDLYGEQREYNAQRARTYFALAKVQLDLKLETEAEETRRKAEKRLEVLGEHHGRTIEEGDLDAFIPNWAK